MLKSTHQASDSLNVALPLPAGWTEHKAPTGHSYYYNASAKKSTYTRPVASLPPTASLPPQITNPSQSFLEYQAVGSSLPSAGVTFNNLPHHAQFPSVRGGFQRHRGRGGHDHLRETQQQPEDKPKSRASIPGCEPWVLVHTKLGRRFVYNTEKDQSYWRIPDKLKDGILALDQRRIKEKAEALNKKLEPVEVENSPGSAEMQEPLGQEDGQKNGDIGEESSEYEEVEVTDDEEDQNSSKRQRTDGEAAEEPLEFNEHDIAFQLAAMGQEYGLDPGEYDDGHMEEWEEGAEGLELSYEDSAALFKDLLNDSGINPYSPWEKLVEEGKLVDDSRYTALTSMRARKEVWEDWSREKMKQLRELRAKEEKKDARIPYLAFLHAHATPKLYWPEFKRKHKKLLEMRDSTLSDKDREKFYREHINRLKLPQPVLKSDLLQLLKSQPLSILNSTSLFTHLPPPILSDIRYISLDSTVRDPLIEGYITTLPPPPKATVEEEDEEAVKGRMDRERRQKALEDREKYVAEEKRRQKRNLEFGKGRLREEEAQIARALNVTKKGLRDHLVEELGTGKPA